MRIVPQNNKNLKTTGQYLLSQPYASKQAVIIYTNASVTSGSRASMKKGISFQADKMYQLADELGHHLSQNGAVPHIFLQKGRHKARLISIPVWRTWKDKSFDPELLTRSLNILAELAEQCNLTDCYMSMSDLCKDQTIWDKFLMPLFKNSLNDRFVLIEDL